MVKIGIVGGALQGIESVYLARKAGYSTTVIDRRKEAPALSLCDDPHIIDPLTDVKNTKAVLEGCDAVIPACEEINLLEFLTSICSEIEVPLLFDLPSYRISSSKIRSNEIMNRIGTPLPRRWPECGFPAVVKPSEQSGSVGVSVAMSDREIQDGIWRIRSMGDKPVIQEYVSGKNVSVEIIGNGTESRAYVTTEVILDSYYDCKMVVCEPDILSVDCDREFAAFGEKIGNGIGLDGLMDVEAVMTNRGLRFLEIDARIPSQTPAAVEKATGVNLLKEFYRVRQGRGFDSRRKDGSSAYYHVIFKDGTLRTCGEKEFAKVSRPRSAPGLFGADEVITDYEPGKAEWRATLITGGRTRDEIMQRVSESIARIKEECGTEEFIDLGPEVAV